jgi:outer membrane receptor for ferrienterochelin and colicin
VGANYTEMKSTVTLSAQDADDLSDYKLRPKERESSDRFVAPLAFIHTPFLLRFFNLVHATEVHGAQRDMAGQPAFLFNFNLGYDIEEWGTSLNWFYNIRGDMLKTGAATSGGGEGAYPDLYSKQLATVNLNLTQKIGKNFSLTVGAQNLLNPAVEEFYRLPDGSEYTRQSYHEGKRYFLKLSGSW